MTRQILRVLIATENDLVTSRQRARQIAGLLGFESQDQTRIATAVSEIVRNAFRYAGKGSVEFSVEGKVPPQIFSMRISDNGPGIPHLQSILEGSYRSHTGMGLGLLGAKRLMDEFDIETAAGEGTTVSLKKFLPRRAPVVSTAMLSKIGQTLAKTQPHNLAEEVQQQNQELLRALDELRRRQEELTQLNHELEDTNRGVVALYAELADKADHLRQADEMKSRFLSNMSHEFRTPLNSMQALSRLLLDRIDGDLTPEQEKQVHFIRKSAESLTDMVNDLLDLAKVESGKLTITPTRFTVENLFGALRGMLRPLLVSRTLNLVFEDASHIPEFFTDEAKVAQIMRNFISNALKFTERGEVRVSATRRVREDIIDLAVADTGIGIAPEHRDLIFQEFAQVDNAFQRHVKGTGLGLPLSKKLAELLGGSVAVESEPGLGSTFIASIPRYYACEPQEGSATGATYALPTPVLVVEDSEDALKRYKEYFREGSYQMISARSLEQARTALKNDEPAAVILNVPPKGDDYWTLLTELKSSRNSIPVIVTTGAEGGGRAISLGADCHAIKPLAGDWLIHQLESLTSSTHRKTALLIDDEEIARYLVRQSMSGLMLNFIEADTGEKGLEMALEKHPDVIVLDLLLPGMSGQQVLASLKADERSSDIPVIIATSQYLTPDERDMLGQLVLAVVPKTELGGRLAGEKFQRMLAEFGVEPIREPSAFPMAG